MEMDNLSNESFEIINSNKFDLFESKDNVEQVLSRAFHSMTILLWSKGTELSDSKSNTMFNIVSFIARYSNTSMNPCR